MWWNSWKTCLRQSYDNVSFFLKRKFKPRQCTTEVAWFIHSAQLNLHTFRAINGLIFSVVKYISNIVYKIVLLIVLFYTLFWITIIKLLCQRSTPQICRNKHKFVAKFNLSKWIVPYETAHGHRDLQYNLIPILDMLMTSTRQMN